jgi:hypothetical protein
MRSLQGLAVLGVVMLTGVGGAAAAPAWTPHYNLNQPATPRVQSPPKPLFSILGVPVRIEAPVAPSYCICFFGNLPGQEGNDRTFPPGPPVQSE